MSHITDYCTYCVSLIRSHDVLPYQYTASFLRLLNHWHFFILLTLLCIYSFMDFVVLQHKGVILKKLQ